MNTNGFVLWMTGLSGAGKSTLAGHLKDRLVGDGLRVEIMDGDEIRRWLSPNLGFSREDRNTHIMRVAYLSKLLARNGVAVIVALISPYREVRAQAKELIGADRFMEIFVDCPLETCIQRDPKGLYKKALAGEIKDMTGLGDPYEHPETPDLALSTHQDDEAACIDQVIEAARQRGFIADGRAR